MAEKQSFRLILGSSSPARRYLLSREGYHFDVLPANIDEPMNLGFANARQLVQYISWLKAEAVVARLQAKPPASTSEEPTIILTADTVAWLDGQVIGKPADQADARRILRTLGGREHELWTGVCLWRPSDDVQLIWQERSLLIFKKMSDEELEAYLASDKWENNSGAYAIEERNDPYIQVLEGTVSNIIGLPMESLEPRLASLASSP